MTKQSFRKDELKNIKKENEEGVSPVIAVILMVAITVVLAGVLWAVIPKDPPEIMDKMLEVRISEKTYGWQLEVITTSGSDLFLEDVKFQLNSGEGAMEYEVDIKSSNPTKFKLGMSDVYAMTIGSTVLDNTTGNPVNSESKIEDFDGCNIAYIDQDSNGKISSSDYLYIYKDYDADGVKEISTNYLFKIVSDGQIALKKNL